MPSPNLSYCVLSVSIKTFGRWQPSPLLNKRNRAWGKVDLFNLIIIITTHVAICLRFNDHRRKCTVCKIVPRIWEYKGRLSLPYSYNHNNYLFNKSQLRDSENMSSNHPLWAKLFAQPYNKAVTRTWLNLHAHTHIVRKKAWLTQVLS